MSGCKIKSRRDRGRSAHGARGIWLGLGLGLMLGLATTADAQVTQAFAFPGEYAAQMPSLAVGRSSASGYAPASNGTPNLFNRGWRGWSGYGYRYGTPAASSPVPPPIVGRGTSSFAASASTSTATAGTPPSQFWSPRIGPRSGGGAYDAGVFYRHHYGGGAYDGGLFYGRR